MANVGLRAPADLTIPWELVNSVIIKPHPPCARITRRNTVSVTPAMGASTVAGAIATGPTLYRLGNVTISFYCTNRFRQSAEIPLIQLPFIPVVSGANHLASWHHRHRRDLLEARAGV